LLNLTFLILTGLPILSLLQFLGGVDPSLLVAAFTATAVTMVSLACLGIANSVLSRKARDGIILTYLEVVAYLALSGLSWLLLVPDGWKTFPSTIYWTSPLELQDVVKGLNAGNLIAVLIQVVSHLERGGRIDSFIWQELRYYAIFHGLLATLCC